MAICWISLQQKNLEAQLLIAKRKRPNLQTLAKTHFLDKYEPRNPHSPKWNYGLCSGFDAA